MEGEVEWWRGLDFVEQNHHPLVVKNSEVLSEGGGEERGGLPADAAFQLRHCLEFVEQNHPFELREHLVYPALHCHTTIVVILL